jgi:hypothetical protein
MIRIVLDGEQAKLVAHSEEMVQVCDGAGKVPGVMSPALLASELECAAVTRRALASDQPRSSTEQALAYLDKLAGK